LITRKGRDESSDGRKGKRGYPAAHTLEKKIRSFQKRKKRGRGTSMGGGHAPNTNSGVSNRWGEVVILYLEERSCQRGGSLRKGDRHLFERKDIMLGRGLSFC